MGGWPWPHIFSDLYLVTQWPFDLESPKIEIRAQNHPWQQFWAKSKRCGELLHHHLDDLSWNRPYVNKVIFTFRPSLDYRYLGLEASVARCCQMWRHALDSVARCPQGDVTILRLWKKSWDFGKKSREKSKNHFLHISLPDRGITANHGYVQLDARLLIDSKLR